jgi:hypothetical protein
MQTWAVGVGRGEAALPPYPLPPGPGKGDLAALWGSPRYPLVLWMGMSEWMMFPVRTLFPCIVCTGCVCLSTFLYGGGESALPW